MAPGHKATGKGPKQSRLNAAQKTLVINMLMSGRTSAQIASAAASFYQPFSISDTIVTYYRKKLNLKYSEQVKAAEREGWDQGLAMKEERVRVLKALAARLMKDLAPTAGSDMVWLDQAKTVANAAYAYQEFNAAELRELRGILEDIAKEVGGRRETAEGGSDSAGGQLRIPARDLAPSFVNVLRDVEDREHMEYLLKGGRGSTKSSFASLMVVQLLVNNPSVHALALRQVGETLRDSVYSQLVWAIELLGLTGKFKCITSPMEIEYLPTHQKVYFRGANKPESIKSIKPAFGHIGILWFEELDQFHGQEAVRKIEQSTLRGGEEAWEFKSYNPPRTAASWVNKYTLIPKANQLQHSSTYLDVPRKWLGQVFIDEAEHLRETNPAAYEHEYLGVVNGTGGAVFENVVSRAITDAEIAQFDRVLNGLDWGYFPDPLHYGKMHYSAAQHTLYIFAELRANKLSNRAAFDALTRPAKRKAEDGSDVFPLWNPRDLLTADSAEPKSVGDFRSYGGNVRAAEKGPESVNYSYKWLQSLKAIVIDPVRAPHHLEEFTACELEQDKDGEFISEYPDRNNHAIDDVRYATNLIWKRRGQ